MPIYEYRCQNCGNQIEVTQRMADAPLVHCEKCGEDALKRLISATSFVLKGSGWYVTDYKGKSGAGSSSSEKAETKSEPKAETKSESSSTKSE